MITNNCCSECGQPFIPTPQNVAKQVTCGSRACKLARIKLIAIQRPPVHKVPAMQARAKMRAADRQRELEYALAGWGPELIYGTNNLLF